MKRFWAKVNKRGRRISHMRTKCWEWVAATSAGYGVLNVKTDRGWHLEYAHRLSFGFAHRGKLPRYVLHLCDNQLCVRPDHLYAGTQSQNGLDAYARGLREPTRKLTAKQVRCIREMRDAGFYNRIIAEQFNINESNVRAITSGKTWNKP